MTRRRTFVVHGLTVIIALILSADPARADRLIADFSEHIIKIDQSFAGKRIHAFGLFNPDERRSEDGYLLAPPAAIDIVIALKGPPQAMTVRRKERVAGIWVNASAATFADVPGFLAIASNRPLNEIGDQALLDRNELGIRYAGTLQGRQDEKRESLFREALIRLRLNEGLYQEMPGTVNLRGGRLFHAALDLPSQVPVGDYSALVLAIREGEVVAAQTIPLVVQKDGLETYIYDFAHESPLMYGLFAVMAALGVGFTAASVFRRP